VDGIVGGEEGTTSRGRGGEEEDFFLEWEEVDGIVGGEEGTASRGRGGEAGDFSLDGRNDDDDDEEDAGRVNADADAASFATMEETWLGLGGIATIVPSSVTVHLCIIRPRWCWCCRWCCCPGDVRGVGAPVMSTSI